MAVPDVNSPNVVARLTLRREFESALQGATRALQHQGTPQDAIKGLTTARQRLTDATEALLAFSHDRFSASPQSITDAHEARIAEIDVALATQEQALAARDSEDAARDEHMQARRKAREAREDRSWRYGSTSMMIQSNDQLVQDIVSDGRAGEDMQGHRQDAADRIEEMDERLSWSDLDLGGYHLGKGEGEARGRGEMFRERMEEQEGTLRKALELIDNNASRP